MNTKKQYISFCMAKLSLLVLYVSFFTVQLFFNFDITQAADITIQSIHHSNKCKSNLSTVKKAGLPSDKKTTVRLNKRYQPRTVIACDPLIIQPPICPTSSKLHIRYSTGFIPSSFPRVHYLRGPPFVV